MLRPIYGWIALAALWASPATAATPSTEPTPVTGDAAMPAEDRRWQRGLDAAMLDHAHALAARGDARSLLAAALIAPISFDEASGRALPISADAQAWFDAARAARPADPLVAWLEATGCPLALQCDADAAIARLLQVDGDNAAVQWLAINAALHGGDEITARTHLRLAANAERFQPYINEVLQLLLEARDAAALAPMDASTATAMGTAQHFGRPTSDAEMVAVVSMAQWAAIAMPAVAGVAKLCQLDVDAPQRDAALRQDCAGLLARAANDGSVMVYPAVALPALIELSEGAEQAAWQARLREFAWLYEQAAPLLSTPDAEAGLVGYARQMAADGELAAMRQLLQANHIPLAPPADWLPTAPRYRALLGAAGAPPG